MTEYDDTYAIVGVVVMTLIIVLGVMYVLPKCVLRTIVIIVLLFVATLCIGWIISPMILVLIVLLIVIFSFVLPCKYPE